jgi:RHH-type rel operon transcriptional repressor/antitoxin RelB
MTAPPQVTMTLRRLNVKSSVLGAPLGPVPHLANLKPLYLSSCCAKETHAVLAIRLPEEIERRLAALAKRTGRTKTYYARAAILEYLDDLEDIYLADRVMEQLEAGEIRTYSLEDVERELGLAD